MLRKIILALLLSVVLVLTSACGGDEKQASTNTETPVATPTETPTPTPQTPTPTVSPEPSEDFVLPDPAIRPVAVMIDNQGDRVLPQGGISQAQIVYEMLVEYNITRYMAIFWGTMPEMVGPVRSSRHYFLDFAMEYDAIYTHVGGSPYAKNDIKKLKIQAIDGLVHGKAFWDITDDPKNWQDTYTSKERIEGQIERSKYRTELQKAFPFKYNDTFLVPDGGNKAEDITVKFASGGSNSGFIYDPETKSYNRLRMGKPHIERNTGEQVKATNIIILEIASPLIEGDKEGRRDMKDIGSGKGLFITGGKSVPIKWAKKARDAQMTYTTESGEPVTLNKGQTWIEITPSMKNVTIKE